MAGLSKTLIAHVNSDDLAEKLGRAISISQQVRDARPVQVISPPPVKQQVIDEVLDHSGPFTQNSKHRFRRF
jgi:hypothetical protein